MADLPGHIKDQFKQQSALYPSPSLFPSPTLFPSEGTNYSSQFYFKSFTELYSNTIYPAMNIELFIKEHSIPGRKRNVTEINTPYMYDPVADSTRGANAIFDGAPDLLTVTLSGFVKTPIVGGYYSPRDASEEVATEFAGMSYGDIVMLYISGEINRSAGGALIRKDPDYFVDGYGHKYTNPVISSWEFSPIAGYPKNQNFSATILLEN